MGYRLAAMSDKSYSKAVWTGSKRVLAKNKNWRKMIYAVCLSLDLVIKTTVVSALENTRPECWLIRRGGSNATAKTTLESSVPKYFNTKPHSLPQARTESPQVWAAHFYGRS